MMLEIVSRCSEVPQSNSRRDDAGNDPCPAVRLLPDSKSDTKGKENADDTRRHVHESGLLGVVTQVADQGGRVSGDNTARNGELKSNVSKVQDLNADNNLTKTTETSMRYS